MLEVIQSFPRTELFSSDVETMRRTASAVLNVGMRRQVRLFMRRDSYGRFVAAMVYLPRDRYTTRVRLEMQDILRPRARRRVDRLLGAGVRKRARQCVFHRSHAGAAELQVDTSEANRLRIQNLLAEATRTWDDTCATRWRGLLCWIPLWCNGIRRPCPTDTRRISGRRVRWPISSGWNGSTSAPIDQHLYRRRTRSRARGGSPCMWAAGFR